MKHPTEKPQQQETPNRRAMRVTDIIAKTLGATVVRRPGDVPLIDARVPRDGDTAHRQGVPKSRNHGLPSASDAPAGRLRPDRD